MAKITYPKGIKPGDTIAITAPSSGVEPKHHPRLDLVIQHLRNQGFKAVEGHCLRSRFKHVSGPKEERAAELMRFWKDPAVTAVMPPWGGEILVEILPLLDFSAIKAQPKWVTGFSDVSTLQFALTLKTGMATLHSSNLMDLVPRQSDPLTLSVMKALQLSPGESLVQHSSPLWQKKWADFVTEVDGPMNLTEPSTWKSLQKKSSSKFSGRMIGGCIDTIARLVGTPYGDLPSFTRAHAADGVIFYFENCELLPCELVRTLWNLRLAGWFEGVNGFVIGRSSAKDAASPDAMSYLEGLESVLGDLDIPVVYDADLGHTPPQMSFINGALGELKYESGKGTLTQKLV